MTDVRRFRRSCLEGRPSFQGGTRPPVVLVGGGANALCLARSLGRERVRVYIVNHPDECVRYSRFCRAIPFRPNRSNVASWARYLLGPKSDHLRGAVLLACSDEGIELLTRHRAALAHKYRLDDCHPPAQECMLNKLATYQLATAAGIPTPRFWPAESRDQILQARDSLVFPLIVKPLYSHVYQQQFTSKFAVVNNLEELLDAFATATAAGVRVMLVEFIPGPDDRSCSYYTYLDAAGHPLYHFTKQIRRRCPASTGIGCYEVSDCNPPIRDLSLRLLRQAGLRGLANVEFKRDDRDGQFKLIEVNGRFSGATCLLAACGLDLGRFVYDRLVGRTRPAPRSYRQGVSLWYPVEDWHALRQLRRAGRLRFREWLASVAGPQVLPYFRWDDPVPSVARETRRLVGALGRRLRNIFHGLVAWLKPLAWRRSAPMTPQMPMNGPVFATLPSTCCRSVCDPGKPGKDRKTSLVSGSGGL